MKPLGTQAEQIRNIMDGSYANMVEERTKKRINGFVLGMIGGIFLGALTRQNTIVVGLIGGVIGFVVGNKKEE
jgi:hypothetical protein